MITRIKVLFSRITSCVRYFLRTGKFSIKLNIAHGFSVPNLKSVYLSPGCIVGSHVTLNAFDKGRILIGKNSYIGGMCHINSICEVNIGENVMLADNVYIADVDHQYRDISTPIIKQGFYSLGGGKNR